MCIDMATESGTSDQSEEGKVPTAAARPTGISGVSPKHLAVGTQPLPCSSSSEDIDASSDDQVGMDVGINCRVTGCSRYRLWVSSANFFQLFVHIFTTGENCLISLHVLVLISYSKCC